MAYCLPTSCNIIDQLLVHLLRGATVVLCKTDYSRFITSMQASDLCLDAAFHSFSGLATSIWPLSRTQRGIACLTSAHRTYWLVRVQLQPHVGRSPPTCAPCPQTNRRPSPRCTPVPGRPWALGSGGKPSGAFHRCPTRLSPQATHFLLFCHFSMLRRRGSQDTTPLLGSKPQTRCNVASHI